MNERIKLLAEQADGVFIHKLMNGAKQYTFLEKDLEKFAELIVRECAGICHKMAEDSDSYVVHDGDTCAEQIKKHFGVK
jgi:hypothetical protein